VRLDSIDSNNVVILGESFTALTMTYKGCVKPHVIIDIWEGGSSLYGWDFINGCIDRLPMLVKTKCQLLGDERYTQVRPVIEVIGNEEGFTEKVYSKLPEESQINWLNIMSEGGFMLRSGWCSMLRKLKNKTAKISRIYGEVKYIHLDKSAIKVGWRKEVRYSKAIITMPLPYILPRIITTNNVIKRMSNNIKLNYVSLYVMTIVVSKSEVKLEEPKIIKVGRKGLLTALIYLLPMDEIYNLSNSILIYVLSPITLNLLKPELSSRILSELKRINLPINFKSIYFYRDYFERYAILGKFKDDIRNLISILKDYGIDLLGRLGAWRDVSICDILKN